MGGGESRPRPQGAGPKLLAPDNPDNGGQDSKEAFTGTAGGNTTATYGSPRGTDRGESGGLSSANGAATAPAGLPGPGGGGWYTDEDATMYLASSELDALLNNEDVDPWVDAFRHRLPDDDDERDGSNDGISLDADIFGGLSLDVVRQLSSTHPNRNEDSEEEWGDRDREGVGSLREERPRVTPLAHVWAMDAASALAATFDEVTMAVIAPDGGGDSRGGFGGADEETSWGR